MDRSALVTGYELLEKLGEGGMGSVYRAHDAKLNRDVAIKFPRTEDPASRRMLLEEARSIAQFTHPHICALYGFGEEAGEAFLVMQYVKGKSLREVLDAGPCEESFVRELVVAIGSALKAIHDRGIVHRDVKPENILVGDDGTIALADFGVSKWIGRETRSDEILLTPRYCAPERVRGDALTPSADQYSLAAIAYECLCGRAPHEGPDLPSLFYALLNEAVVAPGELRPDAAPQWDDVLLRALAKHPAKRFRDMAEFVASVETMVEPRRTERIPRLLAVLPFSNMSGDAETDYLCAGLTEDLLTDLSRIAGLRVASRHLVEQRRSATAEPRQLGEMLGVEAVLEGSVRRSGDRVRVNAQLVGVADGFQRWASRYDRQVSDLLVVQEDIARAIAENLRGSMSAEDTARLRRGRPPEPEAYDAYLEGRYRVQRYSRSENVRALERFEHAVRLSPAYALAHAGIADCCLQMFDKGWDLDPAWTERGMAAAQKAVDLDPALPEAHKSLASHLMLHGDVEGALAALEDALRCDPDFFPALIHRAWVLRHVGDLAGAERSLRRAIALAPDDPFAHWALAYVTFLTRRYGQTIQLCDMFEQAGGSVYFKVRSFLWRAVSNAYAGDSRTAEREVERARAAGLPELPLAVADAVVSASSGNRKRAKLAMASAEIEIVQDVTLNWMLAEAAGWLDDVDRAIRILSLAARTPRLLEFTALRVLPGLSRLREDPAFRTWLGDRGRSIVWPREAPPLEPDTASQFADLGEASGLSGAGAIP